MVRSDERPGKRQRLDYDEMEDEDDRDIRPKRTLASTVVMPSIETKSREEKIEEMTKNEKKEVTTRHCIVYRNRRMFSNLLMGTLTRFQKDEKKIQNVEKIQAEKYKEVEKRLEDKKREDREKIMAERQKLFDERREQEKELRALQRKKALIQYAEAKKEHYKLLRNFIQTQTKPTLFFAPAKHSMRSLELLKASEKAIDGLMELRQKELERELENNVDEEHHEQNTAESNDTEAGNSKDATVSIRRNRDRSHSRSGDEDDREKSPDQPEAKETSAAHEEVHENNDADEAMGEEERIQPDEEPMEKDD
ncbi:unnamed protein product [Cylicostephanus goldi]|uniref:Pinin/SDK/MemA protein domain-containing protein n=1 Tax=Cylicostephanus goldi TaxID=71465 RepID=A0A3P6QCF1_CYLGO|nr:unnamed protein product [Cylicostephanus goldi]